MQITGKQVQQVTIEISKEEAERVVISGDISNLALIKKLRLNLREEAGVDKGAYIKIDTGCWVYDEEMYSSHAFTQTHTIRKATEEELVKNKAIDDMQILLSDRG